MDRVSSGCHGSYRGGSCILGSQILDHRFRRLGQAGLGIALSEIAGGRDDGLGITVISGLVEGGSAEGSGVQIGDSIVKIAVDRGSQVTSSTRSCG